MMDKFSIINSNFSQNKEIIEKTIQANLKVVQFTKSYIMLEMLGLDLNMDFFLVYLIPL